MAERDPRKLMLTTRVSGEMVDRVAAASAQRFQGNEAMLLREAVELYLDLRDALGFDFDRVIQPMRAGERELVAS
jgi:phage gp37-like protein